jgi:molybdate transport system substrate-binding protein
MDFARCAQVSLKDKICVSETMMKSFRVLWSVAILVALSQTWATEIKVLTAGAFKPVLVAAQPGFEAKTGHRLVIVNDTAGALQQRVLAGESFDWVVSSPASLKAMRSAGKLADADPVALAQVSIGVAVAPGTTIPDISSVEQFRKALMQAKKVAYIDPAAGGSSGIYLDGLFERWGIRDQIRAKAVLVPGGLVATRLLDGSADLAIHQISEIKAVPGVVLVGPLPADIQNHTVYSAARPAGEAKSAVNELLEYIKSGALNAVWQEKGMDPM